MQLFQSALLTDANDKTPYILFAPDLESEFQYQF